MREKQTPKLIKEHWERLTFGEALRELLNHYGREEIKKEYDTMILYYRFKEKET